MAVALVALGTPAALAQTNRMWVDPPDSSMGHRPKDPETAPEASAPGPFDQAGTSMPSPRAGAPAHQGPATRSAVPASPLAPGPSLDAARQQPASIVRLASQEEAARKLAISYLDTWSAVNGQALRAAPAFYGSTVVFHGRQVSLQDLLNEKRRFMERWPERHYRYRPETMTVMCQPGNTFCHVRAVYDYDASNPMRGKRSRGTGLHDLVVSFAADRAMIISESSRVLGGPNTVTR
jgi:hypothetical protein